MKKILWMTAALFGLIAILFGIHTWQNESAGIGNSSKTAKVLNIYNWGDYIDPDLLKKFTQQTGYKVNYETFDSNEAMYTKIKQGGTSYDIVIPSEYMIAKMRTENLLIPLDKSKITGLDNYGSDFLNQSFDPHNQYSIPYFWGTLGILYNTKRVSEKDVQTWDGIWQSKFKNKIMLLDQARDVLGFTLASMGKSVNTKSTADLAAARGKLDALMPNVKAILDDEIKMYMAQNEADLAVTYSGNALEAMDQNEDLAYSVPSDGGNIWFDNMAIPRGATHMDAAYAFLNFMSNPQNAAQNAEYVGYATPNMKAEKLLPKETLADKSFYPPESVISKLQIYDNLGQKWTERYNDTFLEFKMTKK